MTNLEQRILAALVKPPPSPSSLRAADDMCVKADERHPSVGLRRETEHVGWQELQKGVLARLILRRFCRDRMAVPSCW